MTPTLITSEEADAASFARGDAFWLVRSDASDPFHLVGRHVGGTGATRIEPGSAAAPASTLCANPCGVALRLNGLSFSGTVGKDDTIAFNSNGDVSRIFVRNAANTAWGYHSKTLVNGRIRSMWVEDAEVPAGTGFWYVRRSADPLSIEWPAWSGE